MLLTHKRFADPLITHHIMLVSFLIDLGAGFLGLSSEQIKLSIWRNGERQDKTELKGTVLLAVTDTFG